mgnify:CR=1 FL=1
MQMHGKHLKRTIFLFSISLSVGCFVEVVLGTFNFSYLLLLFYANMVVSLSIKVVYLYAWKEAFILFHLIMCYTEEKLVIFLMQNS